VERVHQLTPGFLWSLPARLPGSASRILTIGRKESS
jgi:hypothetical protein